MLMREALNSWEDNIKPMIIETFGEHDHAALAGSWVDYIDALNRDGELTDRQAHHIPSLDHPGIFPEADEDSEAEWLAEAERSTSS